MRINGLINQNISNRLVQPVKLFSANANTRQPFVLMLPAREQPGNWHYETRAQQKLFSVQRRGSRRATATYRADV